MRKLHLTDTADSDKTDSAAGGRQNCQNAVMIVAASPVNRIVVTRIVERAGLKAAAHSPETACAALAEQNPALVILDGDADSASDRLVAEAIAAQRRVRGNLPLAVLLTADARRQDRTTRDGFEAVVAKPITSEVLQPVIDDLMQRALKAVQVS